MKKETALALPIILVVGLFLISCGAYYIQVGELQNGLILLGSGLAVSNIFSIPFLYLLWKNWYKWERKILKLLIPYMLILALIIATLILLTILKVI